MEKQVVLEMKNKCLSTVDELKDEISQNEVLIKSCDDAINSLVDEKVTKKIKYNSIIAQNASLNPDVADPNDKENAEQNIKEGKVILMDSKKSLETVYNNVEAVSNSNLKNDKESLMSFIKNNIDYCDNWIDYSQKVLNGEYEIINSDINEEEVLDNQKEEIKEDVSLGDKVIAVEPFEEKVEEKVEENNNDISLDDLDKELDAAISDVHENIVDFKNELDDIDTELSNEPSETPIVTDLEDTLTSLNIMDEDTQLEDIVEQPLVVDNGIKEATNIDEGPVKVVSIEEVDALDEVQDEEKGKSRKLAA